MTSELSDIFSDGEYLETLQFTILHKTVLGLVPSSLVTQLQLSTTNINSTDNDGRTCLSWAAARGDVGSVQTLLEHGANPDLADMEGYPPLFYAVMSESVPCVALLLDSTVNPQLIDVYGSTALHLAVRCENHDILRTLVKSGCIDVNAIDYDGDTPLNSAARAGSVENTRTLLNAGADPTIANVAGDTPMHMSIGWQTLGVLDELVKHGANFNHVSRKGESPLHIAAGHCDPRMLKILRHAISLGDADPCAVNDDGLTYFDCLKIEGDEPASEERRRIFQEFLDQIGKDTDSDPDSENEIFEDAQEYLN